MEATLSEIKKIHKEPTVKGRKWTQIKDLEQKEEINIQLEHNEETRIQKKKKKRKEK